MGQAPRPRVSHGSDGRRTLALLDATAALLKAQVDVVGTATGGANLSSDAFRLCPAASVADITMPV